MPDKVQRFLLFLLFPTAVFVLGNLQLQDTYRYYMSWSDPQYAYLFNGLNLVNSTGDIGHIDHPGTPVQLFSAMVIQLTFLFRDATDITSDVLQHPEFYLRVLSRSILLLFSISLFLLAQQVWHVSRKHAWAVFFQLSTLISFTLSMYLPNPMTEPFLMLGGLGMIALSLLFLASRQQTDIRFAVLFAFFCGYMAAVKISSLPVCLIPFILLGTSRQRLLFTGIVPLAFLLWTIPVWHKFGHFFGFLSGIFSHSGMYGTGEKELFNPGLFAENLIRMLNKSPGFSLLVLLCLLVLFLIYLKQKQHTFFSDSRVRLLFGITCAFLIQMLLVARHYAYHYLVPAHIFMVPALYLSIQLLSPVIPKRIVSKLSTAHFSLLLVCLFGAFLLFRHSAAYAFFTHSHPRKATAAFLEKFPELPRIILTVHEAALPEPALYVGFAFCDEGRTRLAPLLEEMYPNTAIFRAHDNVLRTYTHEKTLYHFFRKHPLALLYFSAEDTASEKVFMKQLLEHSLLKNAIHCDTVFKNTSVNEYVLRCQTDTLMLARQETNSVRTYPMEVLRDEHFVSACGNYTADTPWLQNTEQVYTGSFSLRLDDENQFGHGFTLTLEPGTHVTFSAYRFSPGGKGAIVAHAQQAENFYRLSTYGKKAEKGWERLHLEFEVPENCPDSVFTFYFWNNGKTPVWFDDAVVRITAFGK